MQPILMSRRPQDAGGVIRFQENKIVSFLLDLCTDRGIANMNTLAIMNFDDRDREQFAQLIGYSVSGYGELSYVRPSVVALADALAEKLRNK